MLRTRFYNRRFTSRAPATNTTFGDCPPSRRGKPASVRLRDRARGRGVSAVQPGRRQTTSRSSGLQRQSCLTARRRLRVDRLPPCAGARVGESTGAFSAAGCFVDTSPLTPLVGGRGDARAALVQSHELSPIGARQCGRSSRARGAFRRERPARTPFRTPVWCAAAAGRRGQPPHVFIDVRKHRLDPCSHRSSRAPWRPRALPRLLQVNVSASTTTDRSNIPDHGKWSGRLPVDRESPLDRGSRRRYAGPGVEKHRLSTLSTSDCSRGRLRPDPDLLGHLLSRTPYSFPVRSDVGRGRYRLTKMSTACNATGSSVCQSGVREHARIGLPGTGARATVVVHLLALRTLAIARSDRVVRRPTSAKKSDVHQPEGPSVVRGRSRCERARFARDSASCPTNHTSAFFTA